MMFKLKPCPFCGGEAKIHYCAEIENAKIRAILVNKVGVSCNDCHVATLPYETEEKAIEAWNRRTEKCTK